MRPISHPRKSKGHHSRSGTESWCADGADQLVVILGSHMPREGHRALLTAFAGGIVHGSYSMNEPLLAPGFCSELVPPRLWIYFLVLLFAESLGPRFPWGSEVGFPMG